MKFLIASDIHGNSKALKNILQSWKNKFDYLLIPGDVSGTLHYGLIARTLMKTRKNARRHYANFVYFEAKDIFLKFQMDTVTRVVELLEKLPVPVVLTHGNVEFKEVREYLKKICSETENCYYLENDVLEMRNLVFVGNGYTLPSDDRGFYSPGEKTLNELKTSLTELETRLENIDLANKHLISLFHSPPMNTRLDFVPHKNIHGGSKPHLDFLRKFKPLLCACGHVHESWGVDFLNNKTIAINPGPVVEGKHALIKFGRKSANARIFQSSRGVLDLKKVIYLIRQKL